MRWISNHLFMLALAAGMALAAGLPTLGRTADNERPVVADTAPRLALVIGNADYRTLAKLKNPANDAHLMATRLKNLGFEVVEAADLDLAALNRQVEAFAAQIEQRGRETVSVVYYAGHGLEDNSINYLVPVSADIRKRGDIRPQAVSVKQIAEKLAAAHNQLNILIIDACRDNPFPQAAALASATSGLVPMGAIYGVFIASSTASGKAALDGTDGNSPYTRALADAITTPGEKLEDVFKRVRRQVRLATYEQQIPWESTSLELDFYFLAPTPAPSPAQQLLSAAKETGNTGLFDLLIQRFPGSPEALQAEQWTTTLKLRGPSQAAPPDSSAATVLERARKLRTAEAFDLVASLFPMSAEADEAKVEASRLREITALDSAGPTLEGKELVEKIQEQLTRLKCAEGTTGAIFDRATIEGLRQATLLTDDRFLWYRPTMAALRALRKVDAREGCAVHKLASVPRCMRINNEDFCQ
jgi:uncharacterized caspase-like protein